MPSAPPPATRASLADDEKRLQTILTNFLDVPNHDTDKVIYDAHEIIKALTVQGITHFNRDFLMLSTTDIQALHTINTDGSEKSISLINKQRLIIVLAFYHYSCALAKGHVKLELIPRAYSELT